MALRTRSTLLHERYIEHLGVPNFCNWCGRKIENLLVHHVDGQWFNNDPSNYMALCGRSCHANVHDETLNGREEIRAKGGLATAAKGGGFKDPKISAQVHSSERQRSAAKAGVGESKAKGARVANAIKVDCPDCGRTMNPGALGQHSKVHRIKVVV